MSSSRRIQNALVGATVFLAKAAAAQSSSSQDEDSFLAKIGILIGAGFVSFGLASCIANALFARRTNNQAENYAANPVASFETARTHMAAEQSAPATTELASMDVIIPIHDQLAPSVAVATPDSVPILIDAAEPTSNSLKP